MKWSWILVWCLVLWHSAFAQQTDIDLLKLDKRITVIKSSTPAKQQRQELDKLFNGVLINLTDRFHTLKARDVVSFRENQLCMNKRFESYMSDLGQVAMDAEIVYEKYATVMNQEDRIFLLTLKDEIVTFSKSRIQRAFDRWKGVFWLFCDRKKLMKYVSCAREFEDFLYELDILLFQNRLNAKQYPVMKVVKERIKGITQNASRKNPTECECLEIYASVLSATFPKEHNIVEEAARALESHCKKTCPHLWDVVFRQNGNIDANRCFGAGDHYHINVKASASFSKVVILPYCSESGFVKHTDAQTYKACLPYIYEQSTHDVMADSASYIYGEENLVSSIKDVSLNTGGCELYSLVRTSYVEAGADPGIPVKKLYNVINKFKTPFQRKTFTLTGECGVSYTFYPHPYYETRKK
jgi:hypothetical protein